MFQATIVVFMVGSVVAGAAQTMNQLIAFRALQGIGGGGLFAVTFAIIGDIVPPRQRGRYFGYFTAVFAGAGIIRPLVGGFFVDNASWRWIFYINLPIGIVALMTTALALRIEPQRRAAQVDYLGALFLVGSVVAVTLVTFGADRNTPGPRQRSCS
jgi:MFS family permease